MLWVQFVICAALVIIVGSKLAEYADVLAEKTGLGEGWVGAVLLASTTSLPELATGISAVWLLNAPDLAAGGVFGSCLFNLLILALLDIITGPGPLLQRAQVSHVLAAGLGSVLLSLAAGGIMLGHTVGIFTIGWVGSMSLLLIGLYLISMRLIYQFERRRQLEALEQRATAYRYDHIPARRAYTIFGVLALGILVLGFWLANLGDQIAATTGLGASFVGAILLATTTSLPELTTAVASARLGAIDTAVSNVFGSNIFNIAVLGVYDLFYLQADLWSALGMAHIFSGLAALTMTAVAIVGLVYRATRKTRLRASWDGIALIAIYFGSLYVIFALGAA